MHVVEISGNRKTYYILPNFDAPVKELSHNNRAYIEYKALSFKTENSIAKANYNVKGVRAVFDPDLGPSGGYRCPKGSQYGGYITDRFGRGCGGGIIRRVGRALANTGMRLENFADGRDDRRRNRAVQRRMKPNQPGQRRERMARAIERGARRLVDAYPVENLGPASGGRPQRRNIPTPPKKRTAVVKPKPKPKRVVKPQAEKKPARPQGKAPVKPKVPQKPKASEKPTRKPSERTQGSTLPPKTIASELVSSGPRPNSKRKLADVIFEGFQDDQKRKAGLDALIESIEKTIAKRMAKLPSDISKLSGRERMLAERDLEDVRIWMSELNAAKQMRKHLDSGIGTSEISGRMRERIDRENNAISRMNTNQLRRRLQREGFLEGPRSRRGPGLSTLLDEEEALEQARARAEAAQRIRDRREAARSARSQVSRPPSNLTVSEPVQRPANSKNRQGSLTGRGQIPQLRVDKKEKQVLDPFAPLPSRAGVLPDPMPIKNPKIQTVDKAKEFFDNGGNLNEIPEEFWYEVMLGNAENPNPEKRRVKQINANGGRIKQVQIFVFTDTHQGLVFNRARRDPEEAIREAMVHNMMVGLGLPAPPARMDGRYGGDETDIWAVMPFAWNFAPDGKPEGATPGGANYRLDALRQMKDRAVKERLGHFLFNYALGITDRHDQNGMADIFEDADGNQRAFIMPIDLGWFDRGSDDMFNYIQNFPMDGNLFRDIKRVVQEIRTTTTLAERFTKKERQQLHEDLLNIYDGIMERAKFNGGMPEDELVKDLVKGYNIDHLAQVHGWTDSQKRDYKLYVESTARRMAVRIKKVARKMENNRDRFIRDVLGGSTVND